MYFRTQTFLVAGVSSSGVSAAKLLLNRGATVYIYDDSASNRVKQNCAALCEAGAIFVSADDLPSVQERADVLVLSPGVPIDHPLAVRFKKSGKKIIGEMELGARLLKSNAVAVTGTNGKTTTVSMLERVFLSAGRRAFACGNIGKPLCDCAEDADFDDIAVIEVSSFQLETLSSLHAHVVVELNITEDHLNRHYNMENYVFLKNKLLKNSTESEYAVLNYDDKTVREFAQKTRARVVWFSLRERVEGAYYADGTLFWRGEKVISDKELPVGGAHNIANALACICAARLFGLELAEIAAGLKSFKGIRHRIETVETVNGVKYINDSKATNVDATIKALDGVSGEIILLAGGKDKGYDYDALFEKVKSVSVVHVVLYGENRLKLLSSASRASYENVTLCPDFELAVRVSSILAKSNQTVLLSPASSSFDAFSGYEERGNQFVSLVRELKERETEKGERNGNGTESESRTFTVEKAEE